MAGSMTDAGRNVKITATQRLCLFEPVDIRRRGDPQGAEVSVPDGVHGAAVREEAPFRSEPCKVLELEKLKPSLEADTG